MAKKKSKKNNQKQAETVPLPDTVKTTPPAEEQTADQGSTDTQSQPPETAPPPELATEEVSAEGPTPATEQSVETTGGKPEVDDEPSTSAQDASTDETVIPPPPPESDSPQSASEAEETAAATTAEAAEETPPKENTEESVSDLPVAQLEEPAQAESSATTEEVTPKPNDVLETEELKPLGDSPDAALEAEPREAQEAANHLADEDHSAKSETPAELPTEASMGGTASEITLEAEGGVSVEPATTEPEQVTAPEPATETSEEEQAPAPEAAATEATESTEAPIAPEAPEVAEVAEATEATDSAEAAEATEATDSTEAPEAAEAPEAPEAAEATEAREATDSAETIEGPGGPETPEVPEAPSEKSPNEDGSEVTVVDDSKVQETAEAVPSEVDDVQSTAYASAPETPTMAEAPAAGVPEVPALEAENVEKGMPAASDPPEEPVTETPPAAEPATEDTILEEPSQDAPQEPVDTRSPPTPVPAPTMKETTRQRKKRLEKERQEHAEEERIEQEKFEQERIQKERDEMKRLEEEQRKRERERFEKEAAEATRAAAERELLESIKKPTDDVVAEPDVSRSAKDMSKNAVTAPAQLTTPPPERLAEPRVPNKLAHAETVHGPPTPATSVARSNSHHSASAQALKHMAATAKCEEQDQSRYGALPAPRPQAVSHIIEDSRPPAPSPPIGRMRARHASAFDSDDDSDTALVRPRRQFRGGEDHSRDNRRSMHVPGYPPEPTHHRSGFASRVPIEQDYSNPPPPQPPGYHPGYYGPTAPPYYANHNHSMSQPGYPHPSAYGHSHSSSSPYNDPWNYPPGYPHSHPPQRHDTLVSRDYPMGAGPVRTASGLEDDPSEVFSRISQAIPDLHVLLARYKETHGQLTVREELLRRASAEQEEKLRAKDHEIGELKEKIHSLENKYSAEASRLRMQIGNLEEQAKELQEQRNETDRYKKEAADLKAALEGAMKSWETRYKELEEAHAALQKASAEEKAKFEEWKTKDTTRNDAEKIALAIQFDKRLKEASVAAKHLQEETAVAHIQEKEELRAEHQRQQLERQESFDRVRNDLEGKLASVQMDHEEALKRERQSREVWLQEREALIKAHQDDRDSLRKGWDEQRDLLEAQYKKSKDESDKAWIELHADTSRRADEEKARADALAKEKDDLTKKLNEMKAEGEKEKGVIRSVAVNLESERNRLVKLMECYGDIAEIKSKGDTYYLLAFSQLQKQIIDLAATHFMHLPVRPPAEDLAQVPSNLPSFLGDTSASRQVRAAYVAHTVSKLITYRVFGPFLFSLGRRYDKADSLFSSMSNHIRDKSTRKEAIWRQQTLLAAFTSSGAKQRINTAAGTVVEEIVGAIKHFADPREEESIKIAVKRIVKLAAETWRFARLERELINATMPALHDEEHQFTSPEFWPAYESKPEGTLIESLLGTSHPAEDKPQLLLRLFPVIWREPKHENFHAEGEARDQGCIYHHGLALYDDAESVVQRMEELRSAGLPSYTTTSPTTAESGNKFPPPIVPPPREALPSLPEAESINRAPENPSSPTEPREKTSERQKTTTPPPPPSSIRSLEVPNLGIPVQAYRRPPPGPIDFASPRDLIGLPLPIEGIAVSQAPGGMKPTGISPAVEAEKDVPAADSTGQLPEPTPTESAVLPTTFPEPSPPETGSRDLPTPPHSRAGTPTERPISPLFEAIDEIETLQTHRSRQPSTSMPRHRSTHSRRSNEELPDIDPKAARPETTRRTSGYALSTKSHKTIDTEKTERTDKTSKTDKTERDPKSRYMCESRSAAVKGLYPNSPLAGQTHSSSSKNSVSSPKKRDRDSKDLKRKSSIPDNGTWDTSSSRTSDVPNSQLSTG